MAQSKTPHAYEYDTLVIGGGLSGLIAAHQLEGTGRRVALLDSHDTLGGNYRPIESKAGTIDNGLKLMPAGPESEEALAWLSQVLDIPIESSIVEAPAVTYDDGKFKPFVGFGETKVATAHEMSAYAQSSYIQFGPNSGPKDWVPRLIESFTGTVHTQSVVTRLQVDDEFVIEVLVNGAKRYSGREILFCSTPQQLMRLLPETAVPPKLRTKMVKGDFWTSLNLDLLHLGVVTESQAVHILKGANEEPCAGRFQAPRTLQDDRVTQTSQWITFVPRDITDEPEFVANALKQIKRQVKRAYETSLEGLLQERIVVNTCSHGDLSGAFNEAGHWPKLQNLWVPSSFLDSQKNLLGTLRQVRRTLAAIAGEPPATVVHDEDSNLERPFQPNA